MINSATVDWWMCTRTAHTLNCIWIELYLDDSARVSYNGLFVESSGIRRVTTPPTSHFIAQHNLKIVFLDLGIFAKVSNLPSSFSRYICLIVAIYVRLSLCFFADILLNNTYICRMCSENGKSCFGYWNRKHQGDFRLQMTAPMYIWTYCSFVKPPKSLIW